MDENDIARQEEREAAAVLWNDYVTRVKNMRRLAEAAAAQPDATPLEIERARRIKLVDDALTLPLEGLLQ